MTTHDAEQAPLALSVASDILAGPAAPLEPPAPPIVSERPHPFPTDDAVTDDGEAPLIGRGVYVTPWFYHGRRWLFVVDSSHSVIHLESVTDTGDREAQVQSLWVMLAALSPVGLQLVGG